ncbi:MAG: sensor histidine kinase [Cyclobacteriaceae bacterium]
MKTAAEILRNNSLQIIEEWEEAAREKVTASRLTNKIILRDHLPNMLEDIAEILVRYDRMEDASNDEKFQEIVANSTDHGRHRAASEEYTIQQVIHEYIILHRVVTKFLREHDTFGPNIADLIKYIIETAILRSAASFNQSLQEMQEVMMGTLAHDLRNPLSTAYALLQLMKDIEDPENMESLRQMAMNSIRKSIDLTEGLLDTVTVKAGEGMMLKFYEDDIASEVWTVYQETIAIYGDYDIRLNCPKSGVTGILDGTAIRRLLENLLSNAIKYGDTSRPITISLTDMEEKVRLCVHNYGVPIPDDKQQSIFEFLNRHEQAGEKDIYPSWGMGLTLVKLVAESHGGYVELTSNEEEGTFFTFYLNKQNEPGQRRTQVMKRVDMEM